MRTSPAIYDDLVKSGDLVESVKALSDDELRQLRGALARGDFASWPADRVHGVCILEACDRFMFPACDRCHGSEVPQ
jgi:hypothetical protein